MKLAEALLLRALLATLPLSDLGDYGPELLLGCVRHSLRVRGEFPWCAALPEELDGASEDYKVLLYNNVFDKKDRVESFFTLSD